MVWLILAAIVLLAGFAIRYVAEPFQDPEPSTVEQAPERVWKPDYWCFVGENTLGRWCAKVKSLSACTPHNRFESREACEMVDASSMPLGITQQNGKYMRPFLQPRAVITNTF
jgi:hypothetical protein